MKKICIWRLLCCFLLMLTVLLSATVSAAGQSVAEKESNAACVAAFAMRKRSAPSQAATLDVDAETQRLSPELLEGMLLYPGGMPFGVRFFTEGVTVVGFGDVETKIGKINPAADAGLRVKDVILAVNGETLAGAARLTELIEGCNGNSLQLHCRRGKNEFDVTLTPAYCPAEARYKTGVWVRDSGAGICLVNVWLANIQLEHIGIHLCCLLNSCTLRRRLVQIR